MDTDTKLYCLHPLFSPTMVYCVVAVGLTEIDKPSGPADVPVPAIES